VVIVVPFLRGFGSERAAAVQAVRLKGPLGSTLYNAFKLSGIPAWEIL
jgi:hypothetical protein